ncbi:lytic murein transglycosylase B [Orrella daihaiensis]|uniref:Lytic murein transglycosylase B n=1 Tax=Orrella daihaiensis TaxID=2782176 RepID=A0ABY4AIN5_9BURK|nr:lytic murein transglycosylase B [Orrella daihaiensis]
MPKALSYFLLLSLFWGTIGCSTPATDLRLDKGSASIGGAHAAPSAPSQPPIASNTVAKPVPNTGYLARSDVQAYAQTVANARNLPLDNVRALLATAKRLPVAIRLMTPPEPGKPVTPKNWATYRNNFVEPIRINAGKAFMSEHEQILKAAEARFGVPGNIIAAIIGVETLYGQYMGNYRVLDALTTLSFDYPDPMRPDRIAMFQGQLADLVELHEQGKVDANRQLGSFAGAMGIPQFMPTSLKLWAISSDPKQAHIDLEHNVNDAILSVANFLKVHGWIAGLPVFAPVDLPTNAGELVDGGLTPRLDWSELKLAGATLAAGAEPGAWTNYPLGVINLPLPAQNTVQYRTATPNFFALTQYNRSYFYATAVADLAQALIR